MYGRKTLLRWIQHINTHTYTHIHTHTHTHTHLTCAQEATGEHLDGEERVKALAALVIATCVCLVC